MTKEQKLLLLFVLIIAGSGAGLYIAKEMKSSDATQAITTTESTESTGAMNTTAPTTETQPSSQNTGTVTTGVTVITGATTPTVKAATVTEDTVYRAPSGKDETIHVKVVVDGTGAITDVTFSYDAPHDRESQYYLSNFEKAFNKSVLVGKKLSDAQISRTGGASLVTKAFNKSLVAASAKVNG